MNLNYHLSVISYLMKMKKKKKWFQKTVKYSFYLQPSGNNLVLKKTIEQCGLPILLFLLNHLNLHLRFLLSLIGELILRDKYNYIVWQTFIVTKYDGNLGDDNNENNNDINNFNNIEINNHKK